MANGDRAFALKVGKNAKHKLLQHSDYKLIIEKYYHYKREQYHGDLEIAKKEYTDFINDYGHEYVVGAFLLGRSNRRKRAYLRERINKIIEDADNTSQNVYFLTFTFSDNLLDKTIASYRRKKIQRFLLKNCRHYVANIDYGKENEREHYHAVVSCDNIQEIVKEYAKTFNSYIKVKKLRKSVKKIAEYIIKLTNHALKETTENNNLIYDRNKDWVLSNQFDVMDDYL